MPLVIPGVNGGGCLPALCTLVFIACLFPVTGSNIPREAMLSTGGTKKLFTTALPLKCRGGHSHSDNAARLHDVAPQAGGLGQNFVRLGARIQPQFVTPFGSDVRQDFEERRRRQINTD